MTLIEKAKAGIIADEIREAAEAESSDPEVMRSRVADGTVVVVKNTHRAIRPVAIGKGLRTKVNANIGTSFDHADLEEELRKLAAAVEARADTVMDLSTGGDLNELRRAVLEHSTVPVGTVPIYQTAIEAVKKKGKMVAMTEDDIFETIESQAVDGVDFMTVHCGVTRASVERLMNDRRLVDVVSRGGAFLIEWMFCHDRENPLYENYARLLEIAARHEIVLSLGDGMRPGGIADANDRAQIQELVTLGELVEKARAKGVQAMVEGPGHVPLHLVPSNVTMEKTLCHGAPFYVLGPLVTDVAPGYDHITSAIGGAVAAAAGADFLCYVTPAEHLRLPDVQDVREGVIAARIAAHAADIVNGVPGARDWDDAVSRARKELDWKKMIALSIDPERAREFRSRDLPGDERVCTMCSQFCSMKKMDSILGKKKE